MLLQARTAQQYYNRVPHYCSPQLVCVIIRLKPIGLHVKRSRTQLNVSSGLRHAPGAIRCGCVGLPRHRECLGLCWRFADAPSCAFVICRGLRGSWVRTVPATKSSRERVPPEFLNVDVVDLVACLGVCLGPFRSLDPYNPVALVRLRTSVGIHVWLSFTHSHLRL